jgi:hypothetical protein
MLSLRMRCLALQIALACLVGVSTIASASAELVPDCTLVGYTPLTVPNACLPDSVGFRSAYEVFQRSRGQLPWSRLLLVYQRSGQTVRAHAYCVFSVEGKLWTYDQVCGSRRAWLAMGEKNDAEKLGRQLAARTYVRAAWADSML